MEKTLSYFAGLFKLVKSVAAIINNSFNFLHSYPWRTKFGGGLIKPLTEAYSTFRGNTLDVYED